jgi:hypothetical protein
MYNHYAHGKNLVLKSIQGVYIREQPCITRHITTKIYTPKVLEMRNESEGLLDCKRNKFLRDWSSTHPNLRDFCVHFQVLFSIKQKLNFLNLGFFALSTVFCYPMFYLTFF